MSIFDPLSWLNGSDILNNLAASLLWLVFFALPVLLARYAYVWLTRTIRLGVVSKVLASAMVSFVAAGVVLQHTPPSATWLVLLAGFLAFSTAMAVSLRGLIASGIVDAFVATERGVDYRASLRLSNKSISFLGIGADKLTAEPEFKNALDRCATNARLVRLLLSPPDNSLLETLAKRNGADPSAYKVKVTESLRRLSKFKSDGYNIEVKFYPVDHQRDFQQFRLMFIDDNICLLSWTVWGAHLGRKNPQVVLRQTANVASEATLYKAFSDHFEEVWRDGKIVDLALYA